MDSERTVVMTERQQRVGETEHGTGNSSVVPYRTSLKGRRVDEAGERSETHPQSAEDTARATIESLAGRNLSDVEWARVRARLLEFVTILRGWEEKVNMPESGLGNV
jgi:hypothetical protein